jgi:alpha-galactosidase
MPEFLTLQGEDCTAVLEWVEGEAPLWRYWGPRLADGAAPEAALRDTRPLPSFSLDQDLPLSLAPLPGVGWFGAAVLSAHRAGKDFAQAVTASRYEWIVPGRELLVELDDAVAALRLEVRLAVQPEASCLTLSTRLINLGADVLEVGWLASGVVPLPSDAAQVRSTTGRHNREFIPQVDALSRSGWRRENRRGLTSHDIFPGAVVTTEGATRHSGVAYGAQLAWSGNSIQQIEALEDGRFQWQCGEGLAAGEVRLAPGEALESPQMLATVSTHGLDGVAQNFHCAIRARVTWPGGVMRPRPVHLNTWEGFYFDHDLTELKALAYRAAQVGVERFVLDDGWFHKRHDDRAGLGDWWPDADKYPDGLKPLADHVTGLGMEFGLWVEPEMINPDSETYRAHPDWALHLDARPRLTARNQLVLDLTRPEVCDYLMDKIGAQLDALPIGYLKWDHNRDLSTAGSHGRAAYRAQVKAAYGLMDRIRQRWPHVEIEACAGGGGRIDAGIVHHTHRFWTSDCIDAVSRVEIQRGYLQFMPPELMGSHIGAAPAHSTGRSQSMAFRAAVALPGHFGVEFDLRKLSDDQMTELAASIAFYRQWRDRLHTGRVWRGEAGDHVLWQAHGAPSDLLLMVYRMEPTGQKYPPALRLPMLAGQGRVRVRRVKPEGEVRHAFPSAPALDAMEGEGLIVSGDWLARSGLVLPQMLAEDCIVLHLTSGAA